MVGCGDEAFVGFSAVMLVVVGVVVVVVGADAAVGFVAEVIGLLAVDRVVELLSLVGIVVSSVELVGIFSGGDVEVSVKFDIFI